LHSNVSHFSDKENHEQLDLHITRRFSQKRVRVERNALSAQTIDFDRKPQSRYQIAQMNNSIVSDVFGIFAEKKVDKHPTVKLRPLAQDRSLSAFFLAKIPNSLNLWSSLSPLFGFAFELNS
jgi:hypothetical protein